MFREKISVWWLHIAGWVLFYAMVLAFILSNPDKPWSLDFFVHPSVWVFAVVFPLFFYFNLFLLVPKLYAPKKYILYGVCIVASLLLIYYLKPFDGLMNLHRSLHPPDAPPYFDIPHIPDDVLRLPPRRKEQHFDIMSIVLFLLSWLFSTGIFVVQQLRLSERKALQAEADKANAELAFLKAQVNPHFLFNTLNNIYSMAIDDSKHTAESIMKLSNIMHYVADDARADVVALDEELSCIKDYIDLQQLRLGKTTKVRFEVEGRTNSKNVAPLLLMTFVENAFKYGVSNREEGVIEIRLTTDDEKIQFYCSNPYYPLKKVMESSSIGQNNAQQRLELLYAGKHKLQIDETNNRYTVKLMVTA